jgi:integrase
MGCKMGRRKLSVAEKVSAKLSRAPGVTETGRPRRMIGMGGEPPGVYLFADGDARSWIYRYTFNGRRRDHGLGRYADVTLAEARERAGELRKLVLAGVDPIQAKREGKEAARAAAMHAATFAKCVDAYLDAHAEAWRNAKHRAQWRSSLDTYTGKVLGPLNVAAIDTALVLRVLEPIWRSKTETASRLRGRIESVLDWATVRGFRHGDNPARWKGHLSELLPKRSKVARVKHHPALPYPQIGEFMEQLRAQDGIAASALAFAILTAARSGEVRGATWDEIDLAGKTWTVPAERMKAGRAHRVPLSESALAIVNAMDSQRLGSHVFPGAKEARPLSDMALTAVLRRMGRDNVTVHGFRSTFRDWAAECTSYPSHVVEMALAHTIGDKVEAAYRRGDLFEKRGRLMVEWAKFCAKATKAGDVVPMNRGAR